MRRGAARLAAPPDDGADALVIKTQIPVLRPQLPPADAILPYLRRIDETRTYTNWGPLVGELEARLASHLDLPAGGVVGAASGTSALTAAILASAGPASSARPMALLPAYTFVATAVAARQCGYEMMLSDVDPDDWMLDPDRVLQHPRLNRVGVVVAVAPFGRPVPQAGWLRFQERTGIPVVIDGAASFEGVSRNAAEHLGSIPVALSFHATKSFSTGEGGCVAVGDRELSRATVQALNFGIYDRREASAPGFNGKLSEYHAAVGLAELDGWSTKRAALEAVARTYRRVSETAGIGDRIVLAPDIGSNYTLFEVPEPLDATALERGLPAHGIDYRLWYGHGLHRQSCFASLESDPMPVTDRLAPRLVGLPAAPDLDEASVIRVIDAVVSCVE
jgi:dTDP-4-amino-4,6-dideoxygalactose transaminase